MPDPPIVELERKADPPIVELERHLVGRYHQAVTDTVVTGTSLVVALVALVCARRDLRRLEEAVRVQEAAEQAATAATAPAPTGEKGADAANGKVPAGAAEHVERPPDVADAVRENPQP